MKKKDKNTMEVNQSLLNEIAPINGIEYKQNKMRIGEKYAKIYSIIKYPKRINEGWLAKICNIPNTVAVQIFKPSDNTVLIENMSKGIKQSEMIYESSNDALERKRALREIDDGQEILEKVEVKGEVVGYMINLIMVLAEDEELLEKRAKRVENIISAMQLKVRNLAYLLKESYSTISYFKCRYRR